MKFNFRKVDLIVAMGPTIVYTCLMIWVFTLIYSNIFQELIHTNDSFIKNIAFVAFSLLIIFFIASLIPSYLLSYQYWKYSLNLELTISKGYIEIKNDISSKAKIVKSSDIQKIVSINPFFTYGDLSGFAYLILITKDESFIIPCFIITKKNFIEHFGPFDNLVDTFPYFPFINEKKFLTVNKVPEFSLNNISGLPIQISGRYVNLIRFLLIPGLALCLFASRDAGFPWFYFVLILTLISYAILLSQKRILLNKTSLIVKYLGYTNTYPLSSISSLSEISETKLFTLNLSDPIIKIRIDSNYGLSKTIYFFPRKNVYQELVKTLNLI